MRRRRARPAWNVWYIKPAMTPEKPDSSPSRATGALDETTKESGRSMTVQQKFAAALDSLVGEIKGDRSILAAILCGSLSHDTVWEKSDIDLLLVTVDDRKVAAGGLALYSDGVNVHAILMPRTEFRKTVEGSIRSSFAHSFLAK